MIAELAVRLVAETEDAVAYECAWKRNDSTEGACQRILFNKPFTDADLGMNIHLRLLGIQQDNEAA